MGGSHTHRRVLPNGDHTANHPVMSPKGSVLRPTCQLVASKTCVLHMSVAQLQACHRLTDRRLQRYGQSGADGPGRARDMHAGVFRTVPHHVCRTPGTYQQSLAVFCAYGTCGSRRAPTGLLSRRPAPLPRPQRQERRVWQGHGRWCASPHGTPTSHRLRAARRACAWPPYPPRYSVASWRGWYGRRAPARPGDCPRPATRGAPHA